MQKRKFNRDFGSRAGREDTWDPNKKPRTQWENNTSQSLAFEEYYKVQGICPPEEWEDFLAALRRQLPLTFRINGGGRFAEELRRKLESDFLSDFTSGPVYLDGEVVTPPASLPWYPGKLAWQLDFSRTQLRKIDRLKALHEFMKRESDVGAITRQEAVSMVPPLFLDVKPHHRVLDMCAAPGSKTAQLLEALHAGSEEPTGVVIANDADAQRCNMLTHQTQRMRSPAMVITNHEAQCFPLLWNLDPECEDERVLFDRILCDVPCSGDGTLRKQPDIWRKWSPTSGNGLHIIQIRITLRACELLRIGGRIVYSTCSFNPVEDEAVVADVLRRTKGSMRLVDVSNELPELKRQAGLHSWRVKDAIRWYDSWEEGGKESRKLLPTMFPSPTKDEESFPLERCMRFLPHHQDTGGFFVAVLEKVAPIVDLEYPASAAAIRAAAAQKEITEGGATKEEPHPPPVGVEETDETAEMEEPTITAVENDVTDIVDDDDGGKNRPNAKVLPKWGVRGGGQRNRAADEDDTSAGGEGERLVRENALAAAAPSEHQGGKEGGRIGGRWKGIDPIVPFVDAFHLDGIQEFYGLDPSCSVLDSLIARSNEPRPKKLSYLNPGAKLLLRMDINEQIKVTAAGLKMFERQDTKDNLLTCFYRIAQEGMPYLMPYVTKQRFQPTVDELLHILKDRVVALPTEVKMHITKRNRPIGDTSAHPTAVEEPADAGEEIIAPIAIEVETVAVGEGIDPGGVVDAPGDMEARQEVQRQPTRDPRFALHDRLTLDQLNGVQYGCCVATLRDVDIARLGMASEGTAEGALAVNAPIAVACWRGRGSLNVLVSRQECEQMVDRLRAAIAEEGGVMKETDNGDAHEDGGVGDAVVQ